jgi:hypothetical protein
LNEMMPSIGEYRGVPIHDFQDQKRIDLVVKPEIDRVFSMSNPEELFSYAKNEANPPETRLFSGDKLKAMHEYGRLGGIVEHLGAILGGLSILHWADPLAYGTLLDRGERPARPPEQGARLEEAVARAADRAARAAISSGEPE